MADVNQVVNDFLRDAQYRVAELAILINKGKTESRRQNRYEQEQDWRSQLILWMDILYDSRHDFKSGYNFLYNWTDREIIEECEYLRKITGMNEIAWLSWAGYTQMIREEVTGTSGSGLPVGTEDEHIIYDGNGNAYATPFPTTGGMQSETITQFFS